MNVCLICEASLSHHTLYNGKFGPRVYTYISRISMLAKKSASPHRPWSRPRQETGYFFWGLMLVFLRLSSNRSSLGVAFPPQTFPPDIQWPTWFHFAKNSVRRRHFVFYRSTWFTTRGRYHSYCWYLTHRYKHRPIRTNYFTPWYLLLTQ